MPTMEAKALRLRLQGRVLEVQGRTFMVRGDTGVYLVSVPASDPTRIYCTCPALGMCSHKISVNGILLDEKEKAA